MEASASRKELEDKGMIFFFSRKRRNTGGPGDWGSDVCFSDLVSRTAKLTMNKKKKKKLVDEANRFNCYSLPLS